MSVIAETSQSVMGPHVAVAAVGLALKAWTAVIKEALVVKIQGGGGRDVTPYPIRSKSKRRLGCRGKRKRDRSCR